MLRDFVPRQEYFAEPMEALHSALDGRADSPLTLRDAYQSLELASAIYYCAATGTVVELPSAADHQVRDGCAQWLR